MLERNADDDDGRIVDAAVFVCEFDQAVGGSLGASRGEEGAGDFLIAHHSRDAVGAKDKRVAGFENVFRGGDFDLIVRAEGSGQHILQLA